MKTQFDVTDHGLQIDGRGILPGSTLLLKSQPPSHWQRFGKARQVGEKQLVVATPAAPAANGDTPEGDGGAAEVTAADVEAWEKDKLVAFLKAREIAFDGRSSLETLREAAISALTPQDPPTGEDA